MSKRLKKIFGLIACGLIFWGVFVACDASSGIGTSPAGTSPTCQPSSRNAILVIFLPTEDKESLSMSLSDAGNYGGSGAYHAQIGFTDSGMTDRLWWDKAVPQLGFDVRVYDPIFELIVPPNAAPYIGEYWNNSSITKTIKSFGSKILLNLGTLSC